MYPTKKDTNDYTLIKLIDIENDNYIRSFWTKEPKKYLELYQYMQENDIDIDIDFDGEEKDKYNDTIGDIDYITVGFGGKETLPYIHIYVNVRDYR